MQPAFVDAVEVLARKPAVCFVKRSERTVFTSPAKTAPVYARGRRTFSRARVHASIVAHIAAAHFCGHVPYHRLEKHLERIGVELPRVCQVSLMAQLDERVQPLVAAIVAQVRQSGYIHLDATPIDLRDPARLGAVRESTLWAYRATDGPVWFEFQLDKSRQSPARRLADCRRILQTDGATGLDKIGTDDGRVTHLHRREMPMPTKRAQVSLAPAFHAREQSRVQRIALRAVTALARALAPSLLARRFPHRVAVYCRRVVERARGLRGGPRFSPVGGNSIPYRMKKRNLHYREMSQVP